MAKVPDLFEDLKSCYSESEEYSSTTDHVSVNQKSFYEAAYEPLQEDCMDKFVSTSETSKTSTLTLKDGLVVVAKSSNGKILKKRWLSLNQTLTDDDLEAINKDEEEETIRSELAPRSFQSSVKYKYVRITKQQFVLNDAINQSIIRDTSGPYLRAASVNNLDYEVKFDMGSYLPATEPSKLPVTLRISKTRLFVSAQDENQPVLLKEMPETPKTITGNESSLLFFWENQGTKNYFTSAAYPDLLIATNEESLVHMAKGLPSITDFQIS